ncbi:putative signal transduction protein [Burkholderiales bacterium JOSHI_001]|nr:putative signal transduction protein [Burkholderiales bacterium JOSHI_001]
MSNTTATPSRCVDIEREVDHARRQGALQSIVVPPCPALLVQLRAAMAHEPPDLTEVARIAGSDVAMSATLIRQANGALHAAGQPVRTVGQAMTRLGMDITAQVMTGFLARSAIVPDNRHLARFWEHSAQRAALMGSLARHLPGVHDDLAHTCGLFLHVGLPVMLQSLRGYAGTLVEAAARKDRTPVQTENANHRTDHAVVGALVARVWQLAPEVMAAVRLHHDLEALSDDGIEPEVRTLMALSLVAEMLLRRHANLPPDAEWQRHGAVALKWLEIGDAELDAWHDTLVAALDAVDA